MTNNQTTFQIVKDNWQMILVVFAIVIGYTNLQNVANTSLRLANEAHEWQDNWEKNGQLPDDIKQNQKIQVLEEKMEKIEDLDLGARLATIESNQEFMKGVVLEIKRVISE